MARKSRAKKGTFSKGTAAYAQRSKIAEDIHADNPNMPMSEKMALATNIEEARLRKRQRGGRSI